MRIRTSQATLNYEGEFNPAVTSRSPLILLHGFTLSSRDWLPIFPVLKRHFQPLAIDIIGHGKSDTPENPDKYSFQNGIAQITDLVQQLGITEAIWIGYSLGGRLLYGIATEHPGLTTHVIFESTTPGISSEKERMGRHQQDEQMARFIERHSMETFVDRWLAHPLFQTQKSLSESKQQFARDIRLENRPTGLANSLRGMGRGAMPSYWGKLTEIQAPTLLIAGDQDPEHVNTMNKVADLLPNARTELVHEAGHNIHFERPDFFCEIIQHFLLTS